MAEFKDNILKSNGAKAIYENIKDLPIIDYHCHLSPKEIYENKQFSNIGDMWLLGDHYKWRLMRSYGIDEYYITGDAPMRKKFDKFIEVISTAFGNPIKDWVTLELKFFFDITVPINLENADYIWNTANAYIKDNSLTPKKLLEKAKVMYIATTDDITDDLKYHKLLFDKKNSFKIVPSFRTDKLFNFENANYKKYIEKLENLTGIKIYNLIDLERAIRKRLEYFKKYGCKFADIGIQGFPKYIANYNEANAVFQKILYPSGVVQKGNNTCNNFNNIKITTENLDGLKGYLYVCLAKLYKEFDIVSQIHLAVTRNPNTKMLNEIGVDSGFDCVGENIKINYIQNLLDKLNSENILPTTIIYTLNPTMYYPLYTLCGAFRNVHLGISWWFNDHRRGMLKTFRTVAELGHIKSLIGMLTDSRSFLSYVRFDYFRMILAEFLGEYYTEQNKNEIIIIAKQLSYYNAFNLLGANNENNI